MIQFDPDLSKQIKMLHSVHVTASFQSYVHCIRRICRVANVRTRSLLCTISVSSLTGICTIVQQCQHSVVFQELFSNEVSCTNYVVMIQDGRLPSGPYRVFQLDPPQIKRLLGHQKCTFKS